MADINGDMQARNRELGEIKRVLDDMHKNILATESSLRSIRHDLAAVSKKGADQYRRTMISTAAAYAIFMSLALVIGVLASRVAANAEKRKVEAAEAKIADAQKAADEAKAALDKELKTIADRKALASGAVDVYRLLSDGSLDVRMKGVEAAGKLDMSSLSELEKAAIEGRMGIIRAEAGDDVLEKAKNAYRRQKMREAAALFDQYFALVPDGKDAGQARFMAGSAHFELREFDKAAEYLTPYVAGGKSQKNHQYATNMLGQSLDRLGEREKAFKVYDRGVVDYPSDAAIRSRQNALAKALGYRVAAAPVASSAAEAPAAPAAEAAAQ